MNSRTSLFLLAIVVPVLMTLRVATSQESAKPSTATVAAGKKSLKIIPIVTLKPGETAKLLLTTHCTVGSTRGGGFQLAEMRDGKASEGQTEGHEGASYERDGVELKIPGWTAAETFAASPKFAELQKQGVRAFEVTVSASKTAHPGLMNMHLVDATCNGHCDTDFRVLVLSP